MLVSLSPSRPCPAAWEHLPEFPTWQPPKNKNNDCFSLAIIMLSSSSEIHFVFFIESKACCFLQKKSYCVFIQFLKQLICSISKGRNILVKRASPRISLFISRKKIINIHILFFKPTLIIWYNAWVHIFHSLLSLRGQLWCHSTASYLAIHSFSHLIYVYWAFTMCSKHWG